MCEESFTVAFDIAAPAAAQIEAAAERYAGKYVLNGEAYERALLVYKAVRKLALQNDGNIPKLDIHCGDGVKITAQVPNIDLFQDRLALFSEILSMVDSIDIFTSEGGDLIIEVSVADLWKEV